MFIAVKISALAYVSYLSKALYHGARFEMKIKSRSPRL